MLPSKKDSAIETQVLERIRSSPLKFHGVIRTLNAIVESESTEERNLSDPERIEIGIVDGFDFGDNLKP